MKNTSRIILVLSLCAFLACKQSPSKKSNSETAEMGSNQKEQADTQLMDTEATYRNKKIVENAFDDWVQGKGSFFDSLDENVVWKVTGKAPFSGIYRGKQEFMDKAVVPINSFLSTGIKPELIDINASGDLVWLQWMGSATTVDGGEYINEYAWKLKFDDSGKVVAVDAFLDTYTLGKLVENKLSE